MPAVPYSSQCCEKPPDQYCDHLWSCRLERNGYCPIHDKKQPKPVKE